MGTARKRKFSAAAKRDVQLPESLKWIPGPLKDKKDHKNVSIQPNEPDIGLLRMQTETLLRSLRKQHSKKCRKAIELAGHLGQIAEIGPHKLSWWTALAKKNGASIEFTHRSPESDCKLDFAFRPSQIAAVAGKVYVTISAEDIQEKDYLNGRIFWKRDIYHHVLREHRELLEVVIPENTFPAAKIASDRNCVRDLDGPTPAYNAQVHQLQEVLPLARELDRNDEMRDVWLLLQRFAELRYTGLSDQQCLSVASVSLRANALASFRSALEWLKSGLTIPLNSIDGDRLKHDCDKAISLLDRALDRQSQVEAFAAVFLHTQKHIDTFDVIVSSTENLDFARLRTAVGERVSNLTWIDPLRCGLQLNEKSYNPLTIGPASSDRQAAAEFRRFWGERAELRKFKDGRILECVSHNDPDPLADCCRFAAGRQLTIIGERLTEDIDYLVECKAARAEFDGFAREARALEDLPLRITMLQRSTYGAQDGEALIEFESSGRWPDDILALQRTKAAVLLSTATAMEGLRSVKQARVARDALLEHTFFLEVTLPSGQVFNLRIRHDRERELLSSQHDDDKASQMWICRFDAPIRHVSAMQALEGLHPSFTLAQHLLDTWFASHLLSRHFPAMWRESLLATVYLSPGALDAPRSAFCAFQRCLRFLATWDWRVDALTVPTSADSGESVRGDALIALNTRAENLLQALRSKDPAMRKSGMVVVANCHPAGELLAALPPPDRTASLRLTALAKACVPLLCQEDLVSQRQVLMSRLCTPALEDYDVVLHLYGARPQKYKNLNNTQEARLLTTVLQCFVDDLERVYGDTSKFFAGDFSAQASQHAVGMLFDRVVRDKTLRFRVNGNMNAMRAEDDEDEHVQLNSEAVLAEIQRLGHGIVSRIQIN
ncbi:U3 snoRNP protein [Savitreella phatthalungensis]